MDATKGERGRERSLERESPVLRDARCRYPSSSLLHPASEFTYERSATERFEVL